MSHEPYPSEQPFPKVPRPHDNRSGAGADGDAYPPYRPVPDDYQQPYQVGGYQQTSYPPYYGSSYQPSYQTMEGEKAAQLALILGLVGFFVAGIVLGPLAIWQAGKAERLGVQATAGKVLGWIVTVLNVLAVLGFILFFGLIVAGLGASSGYSG